MAAATGKKNETPYAKRKKAGRRMATIEFDSRTHERIHSQAAKEQRTGSALVRVAVEEYLDKVGA